MLVMPYICSSQCIRYFLVAESRENYLATTFISGVLPLPFAIMSTVAKLPMLTLTVAP